MTIRAFLAVELTPPIRTALLERRHALQQTGAAVRWAGDDGLHATVKFLGGVSAASLAAIQGALAEALAATPRMTVVARGLGAFPSATRPRVVWAGLECPALGDLAAAVERALAPLGFASESRPFRPHVTLGRVTGSAGQARLRAALAAHRDDVFGSCEATELAGYRSDLRRGGAVYTKLWTVPFGG